MKKNFAIIGGDIRFVFLEELLRKQGDLVYMAGFEKAENSQRLNLCSVENAIEKSDIIILPIPVSKDKKSVFAPYSETHIFLENLINCDLSGKKIFCGSKKQLLDNNSMWERFDLFDYGQDETFTILNALPTAEGALGVAINHYNNTINGSKCLVVGFGNIGKILAIDLMLLGAKVTVSARKEKDIACIQSFGMEAIKTQEISLYSNNYDIVFNTVPTCVIDSAFLADMCSDAILIELASLPGGVDKNAAKIYKRHVFEAPGLPGKTAPKAAAQIILKSIEKITGGVDHG